jgi:hypothetical protein
MALFTKIISLIKHPEYLEVILKILSYIFLVWKLTYTLLEKLEEVLNLKI